MKKQTRTNLCSSVLAVAFGIFVYIMSGSITVKKKGGDIGSAFLPQLIAGIMIGLGILLLIKTLLDWRKQKASADASEEKKAPAGEWIPVALSFANLVVYALIFKPVGFLVSTVIYLMAQMLIMSPEKKPSPKSLGLYALVTVIAAVAIYFLFTRAFSLPLPKGILG